MTSSVGAPTAERRHPPLQLPRGIVGLRLPLFDSPEAELKKAVHPPWPEWMTRLYALEEKSDPNIDVSEGETTIPAALSALASELKHRFDILAFVAGQLESLGWRLDLHEDELIATARMRPYDARRVLEDAGVAGALCAVTELDDSGWPRMWYGGDG